MKKLAIGLCLLGCLSMNLESNAVTAIVEEAQNPAPSALAAPPFVASAQQQPDAPVITANQIQDPAQPEPVASPTNDSSLVLDPPQATESRAVTENEQLSHLSQQMANLTQMNLPQQIVELQQKVAQLRGDLQVQAHALKMLSDQLQAQPETITADASQKITGQWSDAASYRAAFQLLKEQKYAQSQQALQNYLKQYPSGVYIANAHYWLGEIALLAKKTTEAVAEFEIIVKQFPHSDKISDARLKLAMINADNGNLSKAQRQFEAIVKQYPDTTAAQLAHVRLQQMKVASSIAI